MSEEDSRSCTCTRKTELSTEVMVSHTIAPTIPKLNTSPIHLSLNWIPKCHTLSIQCHQAQRDIWQRQHRDRLLTNYSWKAYSPNFTNTCPDGPISSTGWRHVREGHWSLQLQLHRNPCLNKRGVTLNKLTTTYGTIIFSMWRDWHRALASPSFLRVRNRPRMQSQKAAQRQPREWKMLPLLEI